MTRVGSVEFIVLLLLVCVTIFGFLARKLDRPYPIIMVFSGLLLSFLPGVPSVTLNPNLIFLVALPPLLYSSAWATSWRDFRNSLGGSEVYDEIVSHYRQRLDRLQTENISEQESANHERFILLSLDGLRIERNTLIRLRNEGQINDEVLHRIER